MEVFPMAVALRAILDTSRKLNRIPNQEGAYLALSSLLIALLVLEPQRPRDSVLPAVLVILSLILLEVDAEPATRPLLVQVAVEVEEEIVYLVKLGFALPV